MIPKSYNLMFGAEAGYGVMSAGSMIARAAGRNGLWSFVVNEYPSLIKGGLNTCLVRIAERPLTALEEELDFLGVMSQPGYDQNYTKIRPGGILLYDIDKVNIVENDLPAGVKALGVKLTQAIAGESAKVMANSAMLGAFCALTGFSVELIKEIMRNEFGKPEVLDKNMNILENTYASVSETLTARPEFIFTAASDQMKKMLLNGNDAIGMGAVKAGVKFAAGYPMTPGSSVLTYLADHGPKYGVVFKQAEDEIAAVNMLIGAGYSGVRSLGATSGGGFALMVEALGFAAQAEVPIVIVNAQRGGPSTGLPTRTAQADLSFINSASQGEFPRIIVAPGDIEECFYETFRILNLAEKYQMPGIILTDKYLADSAVTTPFFKDQDLVIERGHLAGEADLMNQPYLRYRLTADGVSLRAIPGQKGGRHIATSYTHGEDGFYSSGNKEYAAAEPEVTTAGLDKLFAKVPYLLNEIPGIKLFGPADADLTIIGWGSTKGAILEALDEGEKLGFKVNFLQVLYMAPFPADAVSQVLQTAKRTLLIEGNKTAQLGTLIRANTGFKPDHMYLKYDSRPFLPAGILQKIKEVLA